MTTETRPGTKRAAGPGGINYAALESAIGINWYDADPNLQAIVERLVPPEDRAFAVKTWLEQQSSTNFPSGRVRVFAHGSTNPLAPNSSPEGRAQNRRVDLILGTTASR